MLPLRPFEVSLMAPTQHESPSRYRGSQPAALFPWLEAARKRLYEAWVGTTGHHPRASNNTWACEIASGCRTCDEHLSVPCSLLREANEIGHFLNTTCFTSTPWSFLRLYLILLSEFNQQLNDLAGMLKIRIGKPPKLVAVWANRWAKHRLNILVLHHPTILFADEYEQSWTQLEAELFRSVFECRDGTKIPVEIIDTKWLERPQGGMKAPDLTAANAGNKAIVVVPPLDVFLAETIEYFRNFVDAALQNRSVVRHFEARHSCV